MSIASISSHKHVLNALTDRYMQRIQTATSATEVTVELTGGLQAGVTRELKLSAMHIGAQAGSDIMLLDEDVAERHALISFSKSAFGVLAQVDAVEGDVLVDGKALAAGESMPAVTLPFTLKTGSAELQFERPGGHANDSAAIGWLNKQREASGMDPVLGLGMLCLAVLLGGGVLWHLLGQGPQYTIDVNAPALTEELQKKSELDWKAEIRQEIARQGLEDMVDVTVVADRIVQARGQIPESKFEAYRALQSWVDSQTNAPSMIWDVQQRQPLLRLPTIGMVRFSDPAAVVLTSGSVISVGEELVDGWVLSEVDASTLYLSRGTETQLVNFRAVAE